MTYDSKRDEWVLRTSVEDELALQMDGFQKVLEMFCAGDFFYSIAIPEKDEISHCSEGISDLLGYHPEDFTDAFHDEKIHLDDRAAVAKFRKSAEEFYGSIDKDHWWRYKVQYDYRLQTNFGGFKRILYQSVPFSDPKDELQTYLSVFTDISRIKKSHDQSLAILKIDTGQSFVHASLPGTQKPPKISKREREVLELLLNGKSADRIADELFISKSTVENHFKRIRSKTKTKSLIQLTAKALKENWIHT